MIYKNLYIFFIFASLPHLSLSSADKNIVRTLSGPIAGIKLNSFMLNKEYQAFMGIPFAEPPVGDLRFVAPRPVQPWDNILIADKEKPPCIQYNQISWDTDEIIGDEDCLYLNIFIPSIKLDHDKKYPVTIFIYNEKFKTSYNKSLEYRPDFFIEEEVIVVTVSHRLGVFGFLSFEDDILPGNSGLKDILLALHWVNDNIKYFGGDDTNITLIGSQGGATAVDILLRFSKKKLFQRAIIQSGSSLDARYFVNDAKDRAYYLAEELGILYNDNDDLINKLNALTANKLVNHDLQLSWFVFYDIENQTPRTDFGPVVETTSSGFITKLPEDATSNIDIPIMTGFNSREGIEGTMVYLTNPGISAKAMFSFDIPKHLRFRFDHKSNSYKEAVNQIKEFYFTNGIISETNRSEYMTYSGDVMNMYKVDYNVRLYANKSSQPIYYYNFDYSSELNENKNKLLKLMTVKDGTWGAALGDELCYLFYCPNLSDEYRKFNKSNSEEIIVHRRLIKMWTNFIKYGKPTNNNDDILNGISWQPYTRENKFYLHIGKELELKENLHGERFKFWDNFIDYWSKKAVDGVIDNTDTNRDEL